jgi:hypothetical protein
VSFAGGLPDPAPAASPTGVSAVAVRLRCAA